MKDLSHVIYELHDPRTGKCRYVGRTENEGRRRMEHAAEALNPGLHSHGAKRLKWFTELRNANATPVFVVLENLATAEQAKRAEERAIKRALARGDDLVNISVAAGARKKAAKPSPAAQVRALRERVAKLETALRNIESCARTPPMTVSDGAIAQAAREALQ